MCRTNATDPFLSIPWVNPPVHSMLVTEDCLDVCRAKKVYTDEERESQAKSLFSEFLSAGDHVEALTLARELAAPGEPTPPFFCLAFAHSVFL